MFNTANTSYDYVNAHSASYRDLGITEVHLDVGPYPWGGVFKTKTGGGHRLDIDTTTYFYAHSNYPSLDVYWWFDIEDYYTEDGMNGKTYYKVKTQEIEEIMLELPMDIRTSFRNYINSVSELIAKKGLEYIGYADLQFEQKRLLDNIINSSYRIK